jgi:putative flippase GtrA
VKLDKKRYIKFLVVGGVGTVINYIIFRTLRNIIWLDIAWFIGIVIASTSNYILNEAWTFDN